MDKKEEMKKFRNLRIKEVIRQYPAAHDVLQKYDIDCIHCKTGNCKIMEIVDEENLSIEAEMDIYNSLLGLDIDIEMIKES